MRHNIGGATTLTMRGSRAFPDQRAIAAGNNDNCIGSLTGEMFIGLAVRTTDVE